MTKPDLCLALAAALSVGCGSYDPNDITPSPGEATETYEFEGGYSIACAPFEPHERCDGLLCSVFGPESYPGAPPTSHFWLIAGVVYCERSAADQVCYGYPTDTEPVSLFIDCTPSAELSLPLW